MTGSTSQKGGIQVAGLIRSLKEGQGSGIVTLVDTKQNSQSEDYSFVSGTE